MTLSVREAENLEVRLRNIMHMGGSLQVQEQARLALCTLSRAKRRNRRSPSRGGIVLTEELYNGFTQA